MALLDMETDMADEKKRTIKVVLPNLREFAGDAFDADKESVVIFEDAE